jgi:hypothetical protein
LVRDIRCDGDDQGHTHKVGEASGDWEGVLDADCDRCGPFKRVSKRPAPARASA